MPGTSGRHIAASRRAYWYLALVPMCLVGWTVLIVLLRPHLSESSLYKLLDGFLYLAAIGVVILVAVPILAEGIGVLGNRFFKWGSSLLTGYVTLFELMCAHRGSLLRQPYLPQKHLIS